MLMAMSMRVNGRTIKHTVLESIIIQTAQDMKDFGEKISSMVTEKKPGLMELAMKESTKMERKTAMENSIGQTDPHIKVNSSITIFMVSVCIHGLMAGNTMAIG